MKVEIMDGWAIFGSIRVVLACVVCSILSNSPRSGEGLTTVQTLTWYRVLGKCRTGFRVQVAGIKFKMGLGVNAGGSELEVESRDTWKAMQRPPPIVAATGQLAAMCPPLPHVRHSLVDLLEGLRFCFLAGRSP